MSNRVYAILFALLGIVDIILGVVKAMKHQPDVFFPYSTIIFGALFVVLSVRYWRRFNAT